MRTRDFEYGLKMYYDLMSGSVRAVEREIERPEAHECTYDLKGYCEGCEAIRQFLEQI